MRLSQPSGFVPGRSRAEADLPIFFLRLARVRAPNSSSRPRVLWLGPEGSVGRKGRATAGTASGVQVATVGATQRSSTSPQSLGGPPPTELQTPRTAGAGGMRPSDYRLRGQSMSERKCEEEAVKGSRPVHQALQGAVDETPPFAPRAAAAHAFRSDF